MAAEEPPAKVARTEEPEGKEVPKPYEEVETDAKAAKGAIKGPVAFHVKDTTINVMQSATGLLRTLTDGGFQYLQAGAKASVGIKSGRYMYEVKLIELMSPHEKGERFERRYTPAKNVVKVGFGTEKCSLFPGDSALSMSFNMDGTFTLGGKTNKLAKSFSRDNVVSVLLNLEKGHANCNTVSLFIDGQRACPPQELPDEMKGQVLYPLVGFRNVSIQTNFGPEPYVALPFKCHMVGGAEAAAAVVAAAPAAPAGGKYEVVFPIGLPEEGPFEWLDAFMQKNPKYTEVSERSLLQWAEKSGMKPTSDKRASKDSPEVNFGLPDWKDSEVKKVLATFAPLQQRDYVVMDLLGNLQADKRAENLAKWPASAFSRVGHIVVGEPTAEFVKKSQEMNLEVKQAKADKSFKAELAAAKRRQEAARKVAEQERQKKQALKEMAKKKKQAEFEKKKAEFEQKKKEAEEKGEEFAEEEPKEEEEAEEPEEPVPEEEDVNMDQEPPKVTLTPEEAKNKFFQTEVPDMTTVKLNTTFPKFSLPEKGEFDKMLFAWAKDEKKAQEHMKKYIMDRKLTTRVEDIKPSTSFNDRFKLFSRQIGDWKGKQKSYNSMVQFKAQEKVRKEREAKMQAEREAKAKAAEAAAKEAKAKALAEAKAKALEAGEEPPKEEEEEKKEEKEEEKKEEEKKEEEKKDEPMEEPEEEAPELESIDIFDADDVTNVGAGMPLFRDFQHEDWALMNLRYNLYLLLHSFKKDCEDPDRNKIHIDHLPFYYNKYYKKSLDPKLYGVETVAGIIKLVNDAVYLSKSQTLETPLPEDLESFAVFVKIVEECRRYRLLAVAAGEEGAELKIQSRALAEEGKFNEGGGGGGGKRGGKAMGGMDMGMGPMGGKGPSMDGSMGKSMGKGKMGMMDDWGMMKGGYGSPYGKGGYGGGYGKGGGKGKMGGGWGKMGW
eukprot:TRINITY_DN396_c1_g1_i3.p1 TRINITY_DN396_c1_g1~~TRINITY_DN396_c1_g1_i3.p1  ORF type:complete len:941 (-),score=453.39 TRINITY_DN396_c1_g1_i3:331-3153(-)